jgi:hypothetical protein
VTELLPAVTRGVDAVRAHFAGEPVEVVPDGAGGAYVIVHDVEIGSRYVPSRTWLGFQISAAYDSADVYPHYLGVVARADRKQHGDGVQSVTWRDQPVLQLSRRSNGWRPGVDNAALKAEKVIVWFAGL